MKSPINIEEPIGKTVGRRVIKDPTDYGMKLQEAGSQLQQTLDIAYIPRGVYRFKTHEEADEWLMKMMSCSHECRVPFAQNNMVCAHVCKRAHVPMSACLNVCVCGRRESWYKRLLGVPQYIFLPWWNFEIMKNSGISSFTFMVQSWCWHDRSHCPRNVTRVALVDSTLQKLLKQTTADSQETNGGVCSKFE